MPQPASLASSHPPAPAGSGWSVLALAALVLACYLPTLSYGLVWDDPISIQRWLPALQTLGDFFFPPPNIPQFPPDYYRPLPLLSYKLDLLVGGGAAWAFHASSVAWHLASTLLCFFAARALLGAEGAHSRAAFVAAALFAVHPIHSESVAWMAARPDPMVATFALSALLLALRGTQRWRTVLASSLFLLAALLCKENALAACLLIPIAAVLFAPVPALPRHAQLQRNARLTLAVRWLAGSSAASIVYLLLRAYGLANYQRGPFSLPEQGLWSVLGALGYYWHKLVFPPPQSAYVAHVPDSALYLALGALGLGCLAGLGTRAWRHRQPALAFACLWLFFTLLPSLAVLFRPPAAPVAERYAYLPSLAVCWLAGLAWERLARGGRVQQRASMALAVLVVAAGLLATVRRNRVWTDNVSLWADTARLASDDGFALRNLGAALLENGRDEEAELALRQALEKRNPPNGLFAIYNNLATIALKRRDWQTARSYYERAYEAVPGADTMFNLGVLFWTQSQQMPAEHPERHRLTEEALRRFQAAAEASPWDADIQVALGQVQQALGELSAAAQHYRRALELGLTGSRAQQVWRLLAELQNESGRGR